MGGMTIDKAELEFTEYFVKNYPGPNTIICDPKWHAPKIFRAAQRALQEAATSGVVPDEDAAMRAYNAAGYAWDKRSPDDRDEPRHRVAMRAALTAATSDAVDEGYYLACFKERSKGAPVLWWAPNNAGYSTDLEHAGVYTTPKPGYHDSEHTVPVPVSLIKTLRIRREVDPGDNENSMFCTAETLRAALADLKALEAKP